MSVIAHCHNMGVMHRDLKVWVFGEWGCVLHNECEVQVLDYGVDDSVLSTFSRCLLRTYMQGVIYWVAAGSKYQAALVRLRVAEHSSIDASEAALPYPSCTPCLLAVMQLENMLLSDKSPDAILKVADWGLSTFFKVRLSRGWSRGGR